MNNQPTEAPASDALSRFSQWHYLSTTLGNAHGIPDVPVWVITTAVPEELCRSMRTGENIFRDKLEQDISLKRQKLEELKAHVAQAKQSGHPVSPEIHAQIREIQEELSQVVFVNFRNWEADKSTLVELLKRSRFGAMSYVDELGIRTGSYMLNHNMAMNLLRKDLTMLSLMEQSGDTAFIRSSSSGGASIFSLGQNSSQAFLLMSFVQPDGIPKLRKRFSHEAAGAARGKHLLIDAPKSPPVVLYPENVAEVVAKIFARPGKVTFRAINQEVHSALEALHARTWVDYTPRSSEAAAQAVAKSPCDIKYMAKLAIRAAMTQAAYEQARHLPAEDGEEEAQVILEQRHVDEAHRFAQALFDASVTFRGSPETAANAREIRSTQPPVGVEEATEKLRTAIEGDPEGFIAHTYAVKELRISNKLLRHVVATRPDLFIEINNRKREGFNVTIKVAYMLRTGGVTKESDEPDEFAPVSASGKEAEIDFQYAQLQAQAEIQVKAGKRPAIPMTADNVGVIRAVQKKHWKSTALRSTGKLDEALGGARIPELWFRYSSKGDDICDWRECWRQHRMLETWQDKDAADPEDES